MNPQNRITRQRVHHIVDSYQLGGDDGDAFAEDLALLLDAYPQSLIELALTELIVKGWSEIPMQKGMPFMQKLRERLRCWLPNATMASQSGGLFSSHHSGLYCTTSLDVQTAQSTSPRVSDTIDTRLTPVQFEQITGLDASLVFDEEGQVLFAYPVESQKPLEPR
ncbi:MAG: hypothetical protein AAF579_08785 [Cyanobacteria bacterium P01_C01_bin.118]